MSKTSFVLSEDETLKKVYETYRKGGYPEYEDFCDHYFHKYIRDLGCQSAYNKMSAEERVEFQEKHTDRFRVLVMAYEKFSSERKPWEE